MQNTGGRLNFLFAGTSDLALNSDPGDEGQVLQSGGSGAAPTWGPRFTSGTTFPASPAAGDRHYHTTDQAEYVYDGTRAKWLGETMTVVLADSGVESASHYLTGPDRLNFNIGAGIGAPVPWDAAVVAVAYHTTVNLSDWTLRLIYRDESTNGLVVGSTVTPTGTWSSYPWDDIDVDLDQEDRVSLNVFKGASATGSPTNSTATILLKRRGS
jgi:hypothetical protein